MVAVAIIPARGGSKGVHRKNLQVVGKETLLEQAIRKAQSACYSVVVSSDCDEILKHARECGAVDLKRPANLAQDESSSEVVLVHAVMECGIKDRVALVQCTTPFMTVDDISRCCQENTADMSVVCHPFHGVLMNDQGQLLNRTAPVGRRQDMRPQWVVSGSCWSFMPSYLNVPWYSGSIRIVPSSGMQMEIDTPADLHTAQSMNTNCEYPLTEQWLEKLN